MSDNISSNVLFHFTWRMENLKAILRFGFRPRYCPEYTLAPVDQRAARRKLPPRIAIPMVCFCDLPISLIWNHLRKYGGFGIGVKKSWGLKHRLEPVFYTHAKGQTRKPMSRLTSGADDSFATLAKDLNVLAAYTKPYEGYEWRNKKAHAGVRFYDEREWRYVPAKPANVPTFLPWETYQNHSKRDDLQKQIGKHNTLSVSPDDIQYLIVPYDKDENNIVDLHEHLKRIYPRKRDAIVVTTAIMTDDCIEEDV